MFVLVLYTCSLNGGSISSVVATSRSKSKLMDLADMTISKMDGHGIEFQSGWSNNRRGGDSPDGTTQIFAISDVKHLT